MAENLIKEMVEHEVFHDFISHLGDFKTAVKIAERHSTYDDYDVQYWQKQLRTIEKLENYVKRINS